MSFAARRIINAALTYCSVARLNCEICDWLQLFNCTAHRSAQPTRDWFPSFPSRSSSPVPATLSLSTGHTLYSQSEWCFCHLTPSQLGCLCMVQIALCLPSRLSTLFLCVLFTLQPLPFRHFHATLMAATVRALLRIYSDLLSITVCTSVKPSSVFPPRHLVYPTRKHFGASLA